MGQPKTWTAINKRTGFRQEVTDARKKSMEDDHYLGPIYRFEPLTAPVKSTPPPKGAKKASQKPEEPKDNQEEKESKE